MNLPMLRLMSRRSLAAACCWAAALALPATAAPIDAAVLIAAQQLATERAIAAWGSQPYKRVVVKLGTVDSQLRLAPCAQIEAFLPGGVPPWGATRMGLHCADSPQGWRVSLGASVQIIVAGLVVASGLPAGQTVQASQLSSAEVEAGPATDAVLTDRQEAIGRTLARPVAAGQALRRSHLRQRQWFAAGDTVQIVAVGPGWSVSGEGRAVAAGLEGQPVRARTEAGQFVTGWATADHRLEIRP